MATDSATLVIAANNKFTVLVSGRLCAFGLVALTFRMTTSKSFTIIAALLVGGTSLAMTRCSPNRRPVAGLTAAVALTAMTNARAGCVRLGSEHFRVLVY